MVGCDCVGAQLSDTVYHFEISVLLLISLLVQMVLLRSCEFAPVQDILLLDRLE